MTRLGARRRGAASAARRRRGGGKGLPAAGVPGSLARVLRVGHHPRRGTWVMTEGRDSGPRLARRRRCTWVVRRAPARRYLRRYVIENSRSLSRRSRRRSRTQRGKARSAMNEKTGAARGEGGNLKRRKDTTYRGPQQIHDMLALRSVKSTSPAKNRFIGHFEVTHATPMAREAQGKAYTSKSNHRCPVGL